MKRMRLPKKTVLLPRTWKRGDIPNAQNREIEHRIHHDALQRCAEIDMLLRIHASVGNVERWPEIERQREAELITAAERERDERRKERMR